MTKEEMKLNLEQFSKDEKIECNVNSIPMIMKYIEKETNIIN